MAPFTIVSIIRALPFSYKCSRTYDRNALHARKPKPSYHNLSQTAIANRNMGNCLVLQQKVIKIEKPDGKILEYKAPIKVEQILTDFLGHALYDSLQTYQHLLPDTKLHAGNTYYLIPLQLPSPQSKKKVRFSIPEKDGKETGSVRIKLVISKQELQEILQQGSISVDMISKLQDQQKAYKVDNSDHDSDLKGWKPALDTIPEIGLSSHAT